MSQPREMLQNFDRFEILSVKREAESPNSTVVEEVSRKTDAGTWVEVSTHEKLVECCLDMLDALEKIETDFQPEEPKQLGLAIQEMRDCARETIAKVQKRMGVEK